METYTCREAAAVVHGVTIRQLNRMLLKGKRLLRMYGGDIPQRELATALIGRKVGKCWFIPAEELRRCFHG